MGNAHKDTTRFKKGHPFIVDEYKFSVSNYNSAPASLISLLVTVANVSAWTTDVIMWRFVMNYDMINTFTLLSPLLLGRNANNQNGNLRWFSPLGVGPPPHRALGGGQFRQFLFFSIELFLFTYHKFWCT